VDNYSSMLGAFLPFLRDRFDLTLSQAGLLGGILFFSSCFTQPLYGYLADRFRHSLFVALAPATSGIFICSLGSAPSFALLALFVFLGGSGIASFHPQGASLTADQAGRHRGGPLSIFIGGGMIGYSLGPTLITALILVGGLNRSYWAALPGVLMSAYLLLRGPQPQAADRRLAPRRLPAQLREQWRPLLNLYVLVVVRSIIQLAFVAFLPLYFTVRGHSPWEASQLLTLFLLAGGAAGLAGGFLADRFGGRIIMAISMLGCLPTLLGFLLTEGALSVALCALGGGFLLLSTPVNLAMAQRMVPGGASTISALMMGFAWGVGGLLVPLVGIASDQIGLQMALGLLLSVTLPGFVLSLYLPGQQDTGGAATTVPALTEKGAK
jgi:FSR family fosmidomycin resistance protein-like MFS transporter